MTPPSRPWLAQLHVRPLPGRDGGLDGAAGAYALVLALARSEAEYLELASAEMRSLGLVIVEVERLAPYAPQEGDNPDVQACASHLGPEHPIQYLDFHTYPHDDA